MVTIQFEECKADDKSSGDGGALIGIECQTIGQYVLRAVNVLRGLSVETSVSKR